MKLIPIVLIDDHPLARGGIGGWLAQTGRFTIAGEAGTLAEAQALMETITPLPALVILDISLGWGSAPENGLSFIAALEKLCEERNERPPGVLVCSMYEDPFLIQNALDSGAAGYVSKSSGMEELVAAIDAVIGGDRYIGKNLEVRANTIAYSVLTRREREITALVKQSLDNRQIAEKMGLSIRTVENHLGRIYTKTGARSRRGLFKL